MVNEKKQKKKLYQHGQHVAERKLKKRRGQGRGVKRRGKINYTYNRQHVA